MPKKRTTPTEPVSPADSQTGSAGSAKKPRAERTELAGAPRRRVTKKVKPAVTLEQPGMAGVPISSTGTASQTSTPTLQRQSSEREEIARLAYSYWEARGRQGGSETDDWLRAEREVRSRRK